MVLHVGYSCNERCRFCYYRESLEKGTVRDLTLEEIKNRLRIGRKYGKDEVDLSGGEPTIRRDIFNVISYAREIGYKKICIITNGIMTSDKSFCEKLIEAGLNDALFSLHSPRPDVHDYLTKVNGSWNKLTKSMENMQELGFKFRVNTVISNLNYDDLDIYFNLLKRFRPVAINLLVFNPAEETTIHYREDNVSIESYNSIAEKIKEALDRYGDGFEKINVRFLPFCLLKEHENKIRTMWQKIYEEEEWDPFLFMRFRKNDWYALSSSIMGFFSTIFSGGGVPFYGKKDFYTFLCENIQAGRIFYNNRQISECKKCSLRKICPGLPRAYIKKFNKTNLYHYDGEIIKDPLHFCPELKG